MRFLGALAAFAVGTAIVAAADDPPSVAPVPAPPGDLGTLQGNWKPLSMVCKGKPMMSADALKNVTLVFDQNEYHFYYVVRDDKGQPKVLKPVLATVTLDPKTTPKGIELTVAEGPLKGEKRHGIYEIAGSQLTVCYGPADKPRPAKFDAPAGSELFLEVWAKQPAK